VDAAGCQRKSKLVLFATQSGGRKGYREREGVQREGRGTERGIWEKGYRERDMGEYIAETSQTQEIALNNDFYVMKFSGIECNFR
jgi:hypothetical protein